MMSGVSDLVLARNELARRLRDSSTDVTVDSGREVLVEALRGRGVDDEVAALSVQVGWATLRQAMRRWMADPAGGLGPALERAFDQLGSVVRGAR